MKFNKIFTYTALCLGAAFMLGSCTDDNGANPTVVAPAEGSFVIFEPEFAQQVVDLSTMTDDEGITFNWNQPKYTDNGAPLGNMAGSGVIYKVSVSPNGTFTKAFDATKIDVKAGTYLGDDQFDYVAIDNKYTTTSTTVLAKDINMALNRYNQFTGSNVTRWTEDSECAPMKVYVMVTSYIEAGIGNLVPGSLINSNVVTINVKPKYQLPYTKANPEPIFMPGGGNGWNHSVCPVLAWDEDKETLCGYAYMDGNFKFTPDDSWDNGEYNGNDFDQANCSSNITLNGGGDIQFTGDAGMYFVEVNLDKRSLTATPTPWFLVGAFNNWTAADPAQEMTYDKDKHCMTITGAAITADGWKFVVDKDWKTNLGGDLNDLTYDGGNISDVGTTVCLYLERTKANMGDFKIKATVE